MSRGEFGSGGYGSARPYRDDPGLGEYRDDPRQGTRGYQSAGYGNFTQLYDTVSSNVFTINNNATSLERALKQIGTNRDSTQLRDKIHNTQLTTNKLISETTKYFRQLSGLRDLERQQKFNIGRIQSEFKDTVQRYNELQKRAAEKVKGASLPAHPARVPTPDTVGWTDDRSALIEQDERRRDQLQAQDQIVEDDLAMIQEREERIRQLEGDILDVNEIFRDLAALVYEQGEMIDNIEDNVTKAADHVEEGNTQLTKASEYQKKARKKKCCLVIILVVILGIVGLIIGLSVKK